MVAVICFGIYYQSLSFQFLTNWDDTFYVTQNKTIQFISLNNIIAQFTTTYRGNYAPVQTLSYMLDHAIWGLNPAGFHLTNLILHAANGMLFYLLVAGISGSRLAGLVAAAIFVAHPVQVESVAWVSQRKNLLAMFFFLVSFLTYRRSRKAGHGRGAAYVLSIAAFTCAVLSKSAAVVLPLCLLLYEACFRRDDALTTKRHWRLMLPYVAVAILAAIATILTQSRDFEGGRAEYHGGSPYTTLLTMLPVLVRYLVMLVWPSDLSAIYIPPIKLGPDIEVFGALAALCVIAFGGWLLYSSQRHIFFWFALFFVGLLPVSQIVPLVTLMNDRYLYFPMLGAAGLVGHAAAIGTERFSPPWRTMVLSLLTLAVASLAVASHRRAADWRDSISLWSDTAAKIPDSKEVLAALAESYHNAGDVDSAIATYRKTFALGGDFYEPLQERKALNNAGVILMDLGLFAEAEPLLQRLTALFPAYPPGFLNLGLCYSSIGKPELAETAYRRALHLQPGLPSALMGLGNLELGKGRLAQAESFFKQALAGGGDGPDLRVALARLAARTGDINEALSHLAQARNMGLTNPARLNLVPEFSALRESPRFKEITGHVR